MLSELPKIILFDIILCLDLDSIVRFKRTNKKIYSIIKSEINKDHFWLRRLKSYFNVDLTDIPMDLTPKDFYFSLHSKIATYIAGRPCTKFIFPDTRIHRKLNLMYTGKIQILVAFSQPKMQINFMKNISLCIPDLRNYVYTTYIHRDTSSNIDDYQWFVGKNNKKFYVSMTDKYDEEINIYVDDENKIFPRKFDILTFLPYC